MSDDDDIDEADIPELPDPDLCMIVADWLDDWREISTQELVNGDRPHVVRSDESGMRYPPNYTTDPAAAWRLLTCGNLSINPPNVNRQKSLVTGYKHHAVGTKKEVTVKHEDPKRALVECAATLACRGVEPREAP